ncbi:beta-1,4 N-acetylgalactosaminyltransferase 1-like [Garra rufa]|uniref:beta-1,4 N-acetylgalactosaminyltransferase 1-like n=1 Tax=Garra rufa TaxID=137080 RepID=UPI003CCEBBBF
MNYSFLFKIFLTSLCVTALGIYAIQSGFLDVTDVTKKLLPTGTRRLQFSKERLSDRNIGPFPSKNRSSCSCEGYTLNAQHVPEDELEDLQRRRSEEYRQYQLRMGTKMESLILAQANSPLQYPIQGFIVAPLTKTVIPGLAVHAQKRKLYKVSLSVKKGVLSVEDVVEGDQVEGKGQSELTISSTSHTHLNDLLSRVTYTSTTYHVKTKDLVNFSFEDYEAFFSIKIKRPSVPVLYDPGKDINSQVTIATKTFLRYDELNILIKSIRQLYPDIKIIIADDSLEPQNVTGYNLEHYIMPPAQGWFAGRNLAVSQVTTKYFLWVDDDYIFSNNTRIEKFVEIMEKAPELDVVGGAVGKDQFFFRLKYEEGDEEEGGCLRRLHRKKIQAVPGLDGCFFVDGVVNYFLARTDAVRRVGFDPFLKRVAHTEFFLDGLGDLLIASCKGLSVGHQKKRKQSKYRHFRFPGRKDGRNKLVHHYFKNYLKCIRY